MADKIFTENFLEQYLSTFRLSSIADIKRKREILADWLSEIKTKKLFLNKEEAVKSRYILSIIGDVLGFSYKNSSKWLVQEEQKSVIDAKKPDAALGIFYINESIIELGVKIVVEVKDANASLDKPQNRKAFNLSPVDQAFLYGSKMGGQCKWVIVSNFKEIRFYHYSGQHAYQSYTIEDLQQENVLKEFLFLFHRDRFINSTFASTDKLFDLRNQRIEIGRNKHIIDQLYDCLHRFDGLGFVDPNFLANLKPFNLLEDHVWHYDRGALYIINPLIIDLFKEIDTSKGVYALSKKLLSEIKSKQISDAQYKINYIFSKLYYSVIFEVLIFKDLQKFRRQQAGSGYGLRYVRNISDQDVISISTDVNISNSCDCISCNYRSLDFKALIRKIKYSENHDSMDALEEGYGNYLLSTDNYKRAYFSYKKVERNAQDNEKGNIHYFISKINQLNLYNLVEGHIDQQEKEILSDIKGIDLDRSIHSELDVYVDNDVRKYLIEVKENKLFIQITQKVNDISERYKKDKSDVIELEHHLCLLYAYFHNNYIVFDAYTTYRNLVVKIVKLIVEISRKLEEVVVTGKILTEGILYANQEKFTEIICNSDINVSNETKFALTMMASNILNSTFNTGWGKFRHRDCLLTLQFSNFHFLQQFKSIVHNVFYLLANISLEDHQMNELPNAILGFMEVDNDLDHRDLNGLSKFLKRYGYILKPYEFLELLDKTVNNDHWGNRRYYKFIDELSEAYYIHYPNEGIEDKSLIVRAIANSTD